MSKRKAAPIFSKRLILFLVLAMVQVSIPVGMILGHERVLQQGEIYRFKTAPVDPYDIFQGRYVSLRFEERSIKTKLDVKRKQWVYVQMQKDAQGFAQFSKLSVTAPVNGDYLKLQINSIDGDRVHLDIPFDRYYLNENQAQAAEDAYRRLSRDNEATVNAYAQVRVYQGQAVLEELYLKGQPVYDYLLKESAAQTAP